jgi:hypothetical protein
MNMKLFLSRYLFPIILLVVSVFLLVVGIKPGQSQSAAFMIAAGFLLVSSVLMILTSAEIIKGKTASVIGLILIPVAGYLAFQNVDVVQSDIQFKNQTNYRYNVVRERLEKIREAQITYRNEKGQFAENFDILIEFVRNGKMKIIKKVGNEDDSLQVATGKVRRDTLFVPVLGNGFNPADYPIDSLKYIPYGQGQMFNLSAGILGAEGAEYRPPVFEASANFRTFMSDLGTKYGKIVPDSLIKVGSMVEPTTNGNWK